MNRALVVAVALALTCHFADARTARSHYARAAFAAEHPCPDVGDYGVCADVVDHIVPLCAQPAFPAAVLDTPANMAWEAADEAEVKDRYERRLCRALGRVARLQLGPDAYRDAFVTYWTAVATLDNAALRARAAAELDGLATDKTGLVDPRE